MADTLVYVGTYTEPIRFGTGKILEGKGEGIYAFRMDGATGELALLGTTTGVTNPSYLAFAPAGRRLYAVNELKEFAGRPSGTVSAFAVDLQSGQLEFLNRQLTHGTDPCHVLVDPRGTHVFVANFMSGSVCVMRVQDDGTLGAASDFLQHHGSSIDPVRQKGPHAHSVTLDATGRFAFVPDLGLDKLMIYRFDRRREMLEPNAVPWLKMRPGAGPRQVAFHPTGRFAFLINELDSTLAALAFDRRRGAFDLVQTVSTLPREFGGDNTCAHVQVAPSGRFVYASNRGHDSLAVYGADPRTGRLRCVGHAPTQGRTPRQFEIDPTGRFLLVANQDSDAVVTFRIDPRTGALHPTGHVSRVPTPVCVKFLPSRRAPGARVAGGRTGR
jgi:6-phosphogluconolactonase